MNSSKASCPWRVSVKTNRGVFCLEGSGRELCRVVFPGKRQKVKIAGGAKGAAREFMAYFKDPKTVLKTKPDLSGCTEFEKKVYRALRRVPAGKVLSYGELAKRAGYPGAARAVGSAMKKNRLPIVIPCHRVIPSVGGLGEYSAGKKWKRWLLEHEKR
jgi:methylated-DNA-[protein]-cysteine S-methyltransferase